jgi:hypothetical protein
MKPNEEILESDGQLYARIGKTDYFVGAGMKVWKSSASGFREHSPGVKSVIHLTIGKGIRITRTKKALYEKYYLTAIERIKNGG